LPAILFTLENVAIAIRKDVVGTVLKDAGGLLGAVAPVLAA
jgi:hypothetical protein